MARSIVGSIGPDGRLTLTIDSSTGTYRLVQPMQKPIHRKTPNSYQYEYVADVSAVTHVTLSVRATNDAHIALSAGGAGHNDTHYEIVLGGWDDRQSVIRAKNQGPPLMVYEGAVHRGHDGLFWVSWADGALRVGHGQYVGTRQIMSVSMAQAGITAPLRHLLVSTGFGSTGEGNCELRSVRQRTGRVQSHRWVVKQFQFQAI